MSGWSAPSVNEAKSPGSTPSWSVGSTACLNDITELALQLRPPPQLLQALHRRSAIVRRVVDAAHREQAQVEELFRGRPDLTAYFAEIESLRREVAEDGAELTVAVLPYRFQLEPGAPPASVQSEIAAWCAAGSLRCLDLRAALLPLGPAAFVDENHLSREGSAVVAAALRALLPQRSMAEALGEALAEAPAPASEAARRWLAASRPALSPAESRVVREALVAALLRALSHPAPAVRWAAADALAAREARLDWGPALREALLPIADAAATPPKDPLLDDRVRWRCHPPWRPRDSVQCLHVEPAGDSPGKRRQWLPACLLSLTSAPGIVCGASHCSGQEQPGASTRKAAAIWTSWPSSSPCRQKTTPSPTSA